MADWCLWRKDQVRIVTVPPGHGGGGRRREGRGRRMGRGGVESMQFLSFPPTPKKTKEQCNTTVGEP